MRKLDRVLVNEKWNLNFPLLEARFLPSGMSDHSPMMVKVIGNDQNIKKPFRFFDMWMDHDEFMPLVKKVWDQNSGGCLMYQLCCKLRKLKQELKLFNMTHFSNILDRVKDAKNKMDKAQQALHTAPENPSLCMRERMLFVNTLLPSGLKRVFSNRRQGYNGLAWGIRILATFTNQ
jgi:hypothetical protein